MGARSGATLARRADARAVLAGGGTDSTNTSKMLAVAPYAAAAFVVGLGATSIARRCVRASSVRASCAPGLDALESRLRGCASEDIVLLIDFDRTITDGTSAQCHDVVGATECMPLRVREGFAKMLDFSQLFPPELEVGLQQLQPALTLRVS